MASVCTRRAQDHQVQDLRGCCCIRTRAPHLLPCALRRVDLCQQLRMALLQLC